MEVVFKIRREKDILTANEGVHDADAIKGLLSDKEFTLVVDVPEGGEYVMLLKRYYTRRTSTRLTVYAFPIRSEKVSSKKL